LMTFVQQSNRMESTLLQFLWASFGSHSYTSCPEYRTLLCRSQ
jgi:hypothetical protein